MDERTSMNLKRYLKGTLHIYYEPHSRWWYCSFDKRWSGRLFFLHLSKLVITLDCRISWIEDLITGKVK